MDLKKLKTDKKKTNDGIWCQIDGEYDYEVVLDVEEAKKKLIAADKKGELDKSDYFFIRVARVGSAKYKQFRNNISKGKLKKLRKGKLSLSEEERIGLRATAHGVLVDWDWIFDEGKPVSYTSELAFELIGDQDLLTVVAEITEERENYMNEVHADSVKN